MENYNNHKVEIQSRKIITVNSVAEVNAFNEQKIVLNVGESSLTIAGEGLRITCFDKNTGMFKAEGTILSAIYDYKKEPVLKRLFK